MSTAQSSREHQPSTAARSIQRAKDQPTIANVVDAISDLHTEVTADTSVLKTDVGKLKTDVRKLKNVREIKADVREIKADVGELKTDVGKLLHHFGIVSGDNP